MNPNKAIKILTTIIGMVLMGSVPNVVMAGGMGFRNEGQIPIIVQGATIVNGMLRRGQPFIIQPGKVAWDSNLASGQRLVTIYDANQPSRLLLRQNVTFAGNDILFAVRPDPRVGGTKAVLVPQPN